MAISPIFQTLREWMVSKPHVVWTTTFVKIRYMKCIKSKRFRSTSLNTLQRFSVLKSLRNNSNSPSNHFLKMSAETTVPLPPATTVCVTGASGFIGSWLVMRLLERSYNVRATVRDPGMDIYFCATEYRIHRGSTNHTFVACLQRTWRR